MPNQPTTNPSFWTRSVVFTVGLLASVILAVALFRSAGVSAQLSAWKLMPAPERYTELFFNQSLTLPTTLAELKGRPVTFSFSIHNLEGQVTEYPYMVVYTNDHGASTEVALGSVVLEDGAVKRIAQTITLPAGATAKSEISVVLPSQDQSIHFWVGNQ